MFVAQNKNRTLILVLTSKKTSNMKKLGIIRGIMEMLKKRHLLKLLKKKTRKYEEVAGPCSLQNDGKHYISISFFLFYYSDDFSYFPLKFVPIKWRERRIWRHFFSNKDKVARREYYATQYLDEVKEEERQCVEFRHLGNDVYIRTTLEGSEFATGVGFAQRLLSKYYSLWALVIALVTGVLGSTYIKDFFSLVRAELGI